MEGAEHLGCLLTPGPFSLSLQFTVVGVFGEIPEPVVAVDAISIAPCGGESSSENGGWGWGRNREHGPDFSHLPF